MAVAYAWSVILSAFLLFQIQPMMGKVILPWYGGSSAVWSTALLFFQSVLTAGYAYAYALLGRMRPRTQSIVHLACLGVSVGLLLLTASAWPSPLTPDTRWRPGEATLPILGILAMLTASVGVPYLLLSSNSTLMQGWFHREPGGATPYRLYALSNAGSLVGLLSYPLLVEPLLTLRSQAWLWAGGYLVFALGVVPIALRAARSAPGESAVAGPAGEAADARPRVREVLVWLALAACASSLLISVTNQITQEVAAIPFLWVVPLAIYLLSFILAFGGGRLYSRRIYLAALFLLAFLVIWIMPRLPWFGMTVQIVLFSLLLFVCAMLCHCELYARRPSPGSLPAFYLSIAAGGALGGIFVNLLAPLLFRTGFWELQWTVLLAAGIVTVLLQTEQAPMARRRRRKGSPPAAREPRRLRPAVIVSASLVVILGGLLTAVMQAFADNTLLARRGFFGVLRVWELNADQSELHAYQLTHGRTVHGFQFVSPARRDLPTTYYAPTSGVGLALLHHPARPASLKVGGLGLGVGVIGAYAQPGDRYRFYEINPDMIAVAEGQAGYFSFLADSAAQTTIVAGDARVSLEREWDQHGSQGFDLLVLDAFSGDAVPVHLLTREAFDLYLRHTAPDGLLAVNVSNRYFDLVQQVYRLAEALDLAAVRIEDRGDGIQSYDSVWMLLARNSASLQSPDFESRQALRPALPAGLRLWTDDYSNLLQALR